MTFKSKMHLWLLTAKVPTPLSGLLGRQWATFSSFCCCCPSSLLSKQCMQKSKHICKGMHMPWECPLVQADELCRGLPQNYVHNCSSICLWAAVGGFPCGKFPPCMLHACMLFLKNATVLLLCAHFHCSNHLSAAASAFLLLLSTHLYLLQLA